MEYYKLRKNIIIYAVYFVATAFLKNLALSILSSFKYMIDVTVLFKNDVTAKIAFLDSFQPLSPLPLFFPTPPSHVTTQKVTNLSSERQTINIDA